MSSVAIDHAAGSDSASFDWPRVVHTIFLSRALDELEVGRLLPARQVLYQFSARGHDVTQVILNLKELTLRLHTDKPKLLRLEARGKKEVTAADIIEDAEVDVLNPEMHIATLDKKDAKLAMELVVERGKGYVPAERHIYAAWLPTRHLPSKVRAFVDFLRERFGPEPYWDRESPGTTPA